MYEQIRITGARIHTSVLNYIYATIYVTFIRLTYVYQKWAGQ